MLHYFLAVCADSGEVFFRLYIYPYTASGSSCLFSNIGTVLFDGMKFLNSLSSHSSESLDSQLWNDKL